MTADPANQPNEQPPHALPEIPAPHATDASVPPAPPATDSQTTASSVPNFITAPPAPWSHRRGEPRTFAAIWLLFLFAATILSVGAVGLFGLVSTDVYRPAARVMLEIVTVGVVILWPMVRLSQEP